MWALARTGRVLLQWLFPLNNRSFSVMIQATQLRRGNTILMNGELYQVVDYQHITPGNWRGMVQTKLRKLSTGSIIDHRFRSEDRVERAVLDEREMEYLYKDGGDHYFMDTENYEQIHFNEEVLGDAVQYLVANSKIKVEFYDGKRWEWSCPQQWSFASSRLSRVCRPQ